MKIRNFSIGKFVIATLYASAWLSMHNVPAQEWDRSQEDILINQENYVKNIFAGLKSSVELTYIMRKFPKGVIHSHLTGALTPENYLNEAIKADLHFDKSEFIFFKKEDRHVFKSENIESAE